MNREKVLVVAERMVEYGFYGLIFFLPISKALIETCSGFIILGFLIKKIISRDLTVLEIDKKVFWLLLAFFVFNAMSLLNSGPLLGKSLKALIFKWGEYLLLFVAAVDQFRNAKCIKRFFYILVFISVLIGISALTQKFFGFEFFRLKSMDGIGVTGPFGNPNGLSAYLILPLLVSLAVAHCRWPKRAINVALFLSCVVLFAALLLTFSRAGWLGTTAGLIFISMLLLDKRVLLLTLFFFLLALESYPPFL